MTVFPLKQVVEEWRLKCEDLSTELDSSQRDCRQQSSDLFRLRAAWDETVEQLDSVRRENKNLGDEIKDLLDQLGEGGRSIHELDKQRRRLQVCKAEIHQSLFLWFYLLVEFFLILSCQRIARLGMRLAKKVARRAVKL